VISWLLSRLANNLLIASKSYPMGDEIASHAATGIRAWAPIGVGCPPICQEEGEILLKSEILKIDEIYVPAERRNEINAEKIEQIAEEIMEEAEEQPIQVRRGKGRFVLLSGVNRLEARKALGEATIRAFVVGARLH
jgi:hypothetical protein